MKEEDKEKVMKSKMEEGRVIHTKEERTRGRKKKKKKKKGKRNTNIKSSKQFRTKGQMEVYIVTYLDTKTGR